MKQMYPVAAAALLAISGAAAQTTWVVDKAHSNVKFTVAHLVIAEVGGRFTDFDVTLTQGKEDFSDATLVATIATKSINTDNEQRDNHLRSDDFLNAEKYPRIAFKSTKWEPTGKDTYRVHGDLTIRDITKPVVLETKFNGAIKDTRGNTKAGFRATTTIDRFDYNVKWNKAVEAGGLVAGREIAVTLLVELQKK